MGHSGFCILGTGSLPQLPSTTISMWSISGFTSSLRLFYTLGFYCNESNIPTSLCFVWNVENVNRCRDTEIKMVGLYATNYLPDGGQVSLPGPQFPHLWVDLLCHIMFWHSEFFSFFKNGVLCLCQHLIFKGILFCFVWQRESVVQWSECSLLSQKVWVQI